MSWITGFADKAEQILNKIDQSAADKLQKKKPAKYIEEPILSEVTTESNLVKQSFLSGQRSRLTPPPSPAKKPLPQVKSAPVMVNQVQEEEKLIDFLNDNSSSTSETKPDNLLVKDVEAGGLDGEKQMLKNEVRVLNNELSLLLHRTRAAEKESENLKAELQDVEKSRPSLTEEIKNLRTQVKSLEQENSALAAEKRQLDDSATAQTAKNDQILELQKQIKNLKEREEELTQRLESKEQEYVALDSVRHQHQLEVDSLNQRVTELRSELDQLRTRAQRTLSDKETIINQLRANNSDSSVETSFQTELAQLREEKQMLMDEHQETVGQLETVRRRLVEVEHTLDAVRENAARTQQELQDRLARELQKRNIIEDDFRIQTQELRLVREEYSAQRGQLTARLREKEAELAQLHSQLAGAPRPPAPHLLPGELEVRLSSLTKTLIQKQTTLESVTTERNQLRMQLEELEHKHREHLMMLHQSRIISANDTDDAKAQVPSFMMESPFDTGVARRVKRAYSSLDAVSIRTGVFLRRYPLARIMVILYVVLLHSLVLVVLCSRTPDNAQK
ncbi:golgin-84 [Macrosteles quadrilineatus]|uniref:golgin-84 n=1 Tax=Macrosteles quadrilineatus TaxID=74068 RepID=UPI0023E1E32A|nr:golgin-84 [Macrosteles quadrilineatus]